MPTAGGLVDVMQNGRRVPAIAHVGKTSYLFVLNRTNGMPIVPVDERRCQRATCRPSGYPPTQPFPCGQARSPR